MSDFVHLHVHSHYSLLDGVPSVRALVAAAAEQGMPALALTDHGTMAGAFEFYKEARARKVKPIIGLETWVAAKGRRYRGDKEKSFHLVLLCRDRTGYQNLMKLSSLAYLEGFHYKPRVDRELLAQCGAGLIGMSACVGGEIPQALLEGHYDRAREALAFYQSVFGKEHFYLELQDHGTEEEKVIGPQLIRLARDQGAPLVVANDVHYLKKQDALAQDVLTCVGSGKTLADPKRFRYPSDEFYFKSPDEMKALFTAVPEAYANTLRIASACNLELEFGKYYLPKFDVEPGETADSRLERLCREALPTRYPGITAEVEQRLATELTMIRGMGFSDYFLIVGDYVAFARTQGIAVGPGRGPTACSMVCFLLGITGLDPLAHGLYFERFLCPERVTLPDIDVDFCSERRDEVIAYLRRKYGTEKVCRMVTFDKLRSKAALKEVARVLEIPSQEANRIAKAVPEEYSFELAAALAESADLRLWADKYPRLFEMARILEGVPRSMDRYDSGVLIAPDTLYQFVPLQVRDGEIATQLGWQHFRDVGLQWMNLLGLGTLSRIRKVVAEIEKRRGEHLEVEGLPLDDHRTFAMLARGETKGVFAFAAGELFDDQFSRLYPGSIKQMVDELVDKVDLLRRVEPSCLEDLAAVLALFRPGPIGSGMTDEFIESKHSRKVVVYPHPALKAVLSETYGVWVYQEQIMHAASILAEFSMGQADQLRRAMGKRDGAKVEKMRALFVRQTVDNKHLAPPCDAARAGDVFDVMFEAAQYGFCKAHALSYALISYQTAWLKVNYPIEFAAVFLPGEPGHAGRPRPVTKGTARRTRPAPRGPRRPASP